MDEARIATLLTPFIGDCDAPALFRSISIYVDILLRWNARVSLTAIRDPGEIVTRHFGESLFTARHLFPATHVESHVGVAPRAVPTRRRSRVDEDNDRAEQRDPSPLLTLADVGSGAGFPGLPIKLWVPHLSVTLIESNHKKATFLREAVRALTLTDVDIQIARAESLPPASFDVVTLRAVERFKAALPTAAALVKPAGRLALLIGSSQEDLAHSILPSYVFSPPVPIPQSASRVLLIGHRQVEPT